MCSLMAAVFSGRLSELMMTKPNPSVSLRWMTTSLGWALGGTVARPGSCCAEPEPAPEVGAAETGAGALLEPGAPQEE